MVGGSRVRAARRIATPRLLARHARSHRSVTPASSRCSMLCHTVAVISRLLFSLQTLHMLRTLQPVAVISRLLFSWWHEDDQLGINSMLEADDVSADPKQVADCRYTRYIVTSATHAPNITDVTDATDVAMPASWNAEAGGHRASPDHVPRAIETPSGRTWSAWTPSAHHCNVCRNAQSAHRVTCHARPAHAHPAARLTYALAPSARRSCWPTP